MFRKFIRKKEDGIETLEFLIILAAATVMVSAILFSAKNVKSTAERGKMTVTQSQDSYLENWESKDD